MRAIVLLLACVTLAACGSDDGGLSVDEYRERGNDLCAEARDDAQALEAPRSIDGMTDYLERLRELSQSYDRRFEELDPPDELAQQHERAIDVNERLDRSYAEMVRRLRAASDPAVTLRREVERLLPQLRRGDEVFRRLGLNACLAGPQILDTAGPS